MQRVARMSEIDDDGRYVYDRLYSPRGSSISPRGSVYEVKFGFTTDSKRKNYKNAAFAAFFVLRRLENLRQALFC